MVKTHYEFYPKIFAPAAFGYIIQAVVKNEIIKSFNLIIAKMDENSKSPNNPNGRKLLIVDDDSFLLNMYLLKFEKEGFRVEIAKSGQEALSKIRNGYDPDVMLVDIAMPSMSGMDMLEEAAKNGLAKSAIKIVLTNQGKPEDVERAKGLSVSGYLVKANTIPSEVLREVMKFIDPTKQTPAKKE